MKIAGQRNPGAWYRANKFLVAADTVADHTALVEIIKELNTIQPYLDALADIAMKTGNAQLPAFQSADTYAAILAAGIPLNVWMGTLAFDTYTPVGVKPNIKYKADHVKEARAFGGDLRAAVVRYKFARRELRDLANTGSRASGNPSGVADANKAT